jgi:hypothetical protein
MWQVRVSLDIDPPGNHLETRETVRDAYLELVGREDIFEPDMIAALADGEVTYTLHVDQPNRQDAMLFAVGALRAALHGAGGSTPGWEEGRIEEWLECAEIATKPTKELVSASS